MFLQQLVVPLSLLVEQLLLSLLLLLVSLTVALPLPPVCCLKAALDPRAVHCHSGVHGSPRKARYGVYELTPWGEPLRGAALREFVDLSG